MIKTSIQDAINQQIVREMYSSNLYLAMASYYATQNLNGFSKWMHFQAEEEMMHALKFFDYLVNRGGKPEVGAIAAPKKDWDSPLQAFTDAYAHEQLVTSWIYDIVDLAIAEKDHATHSLLPWSVNEQVEEEANTSLIVNKLKLIGPDPQGLFLIDSELGNRPAPTPIAAK